MNKYYKRIIKIIVFILLIIILDQIVGFILRKYYFTQISGNNYELTYLFKECNADIIILGNSKAKHHYDTRLIKDSLKMSCFNAGKDGITNNLIYYSQLKIITERYLPKTIILESDLDFSMSAGLYERLSVLLPYYKKYPVLDSVILLRGPYEKVKLLSAIYPFNSSISSIIRFNSSHLTSYKQTINGFVPLQNKISDKNFLGREELEKDKKKSYLIDTNSISAIRKIIFLCKQKNIALYIFNSPIYHNTLEERIFNNQSAENIKYLFSQNNINFFDFSFDTTFIGRYDWFNDNIHLNEDGAKEFTKKIIKIIKNN